MMDDRVEIRFAENGFVLRYADPEIVEKNRESEEGYEDPDVEQVFNDYDSLMEGVGRVVSMISDQAGEEAAERSPEEDFNQAFDEASRNE